ncbi:ABC transporter ATP-binding protein [Gordonia humi]|uniref:ATP-binding cassette subfamily B protein n=1 Tax=Gordonia humi TaxID=686429 RepID=A0A840F2Y3_9ACTN|nr:ABC transporter ATP-binding protein [Gordonia humi]MBB4136296.1 ATP-binding cassette subfamily B protein [Gordonia humi]
MTARTVPPTFWRLAADVRPALVVAGLLSAVGGLATVIPAIAAVDLARALAPLARGASGDIDPVRVTVALVVLVVGLSIGNLATGGAYAVSHRADNEFGDRLRRRQIDHLVRLPLDWFGRTPSGAVKKIVQDDVARTHQLIAHVVPDSVGSAVGAVAGLAYVYVLDWRLGLIATIPPAAVAAAFPVMMKDSSQQYARYSRAGADLAAATAELVDGIAPIKMFGLGRRGRDRFGDASRRLVRVYRDWVGQTRIGTALVSTFSSPGFAVAVTAVGSAVLVATAGAAPEAAVATVVLAAAISSPIFQIVQTGSHVHEANGAAAELTDFFAVPGAVEPTDPVVPADSGVGVVGVDFAYRPGRPVLHDVDLHAGSGTVTALVGPSGAGKSTLAAMIPRLVEPDTGRVRLGGADLRQVTDRALYSRIGFVFSESGLLRMSVRDNIASSRPDASDAEVEAAARAAAVHDRITRLPRGYASIIGDDARLSGGERQRVAIARAIIADPSVVVLDEATAHADPDSETQVHRGLARLVHDRGLVVVAHRLHTVVGADQIVVLDAGRIVETGTHRDLLAADGQYAQMWRRYATATELMETPQ